MTVGAGHGRCIVANLFSQKMDQTSDVEMLVFILDFKKKGGVQQTKHNGFPKTFSFSS